MGMDTKPNIQDTGNEGVGVKPIYGFEGIPSLPPKWTYAVPEIVCPSLEYDTVADNRMRYETIHHMDKSRREVWISLN